MNYLSHNLKFLIKRFGSNQGQLASFVGKKQTTISNWVNELTEPDASDLVQIHRFFGVSIDSLVKSDLSHSALLTEEHLHQFKKLRKPKVDSVGAVEPVSKNYLDQDAALLTLGESESSYRKTLEKTLQELQQKLDELKQLVTTSRPRKR